MTHNHDINKISDSTKSYLEDVLKKMAHNNDTNKTSDSNPPDWKMRQRQVNYNNDMTRTQFFWYLVLFGIPLSLTMTIIFWVIITMVSGMGLLDLLLL